mgnify:CR=1 FL=1
MLIFAQNAQTDDAWRFLTLIVLAYFGINLVSAVRVTAYMKRAGRPAWPWFLATLLLTAIPYSVYALYHNFNWLWQSGPAERPAEPAEEPADGAKPPNDPSLAGADEPADRCPHCGSQLPAAERDGATVCPSCRMNRNGEHLA